MASSAVPRSVEGGSGWRSRQSKARLAPAGVGAGGGAPPAAIPQGPISPAGLFSGIRYPRYAFAFAVALIGTLAIRVHELVPASGAIHPTIVIAVLSLLLLFPQVTGAAGKQAVLDVSVVLTFAYFGWAAAMVPFSYWPGNSVEILVTSAPAAVVMMIAILLLKPDRRNLDRIHVAFVLLAFAQVLGTRIFGYVSWTGRLSGFGTFDSNDNASIAALAFPFAVALVVRHRGWRRYAGIAAAGLFLVSMGWFNSRGGTLAMGVGILTLVLLQPGRRRGSILLFALVAGTLFWVTAPEGYRSRIRGMSSLEDDYNLTNYYGRKQVWARARGYVMQHPLSGVGMSAFPVAEGATLTEASSRGKWSNTHNAYLQAYAELGIPGGTVFILLLLTGLRRATLLARPPGGRQATVLARPEYVASLAAFAAGAYFLSHAYFYISFCLLAMIAFAVRVAATENPHVVQAKGAYLAPALAAAGRARARLSS